MWRKDRSAYRDGGVFSAVSKEVFRHGSPPGIGYIYHAAEQTAGDREAAYIAERNGIGSMVAGFSMQWQNEQGKRGIEMGFQGEMKQMFLHVAAGNVSPEEWEKWWNSNKDGPEEAMEAGRNSRSSTHAAAVAGKLLAPYPQWFLQQYAPIRR